MSLKPGTLVKYAALQVVLGQSAAAHCHRSLNLTWNEIEAKLTGIVLKNLENDRLQVRWFGINKTFNYEYEEYLEVVK